MLAALLASRVVRPGLDLGAPAVAEPAAVTAASSACAPVRTAATLRRASAGRGPTSVRTARPGGSVRTAATLRRTSISTGTTTVRTAGSGGTVRTAVPPLWTSTGGRTTSVGRPAMLRRSSVGRGSTTVRTGETGRTIGAAVGRSLRTSAHGPVGSACSGGPRRAVGGRGPCRCSWPVAALAPVGPARRCWGASVTSGAVPGTLRGRARCRGPLPTPSVWSASGDRRTPAA